MCISFTVDLTQKGRYKTAIENLLMLLQILIIIILNPSTQMSRSHKNWKVVL